MLLLLSLQRDAKGQEASPGVTLRSETNQVLVDVVVTEKNRAIHGLDKSRFRVQEDGKDRSIASFEEHLAQDSSAIKKPAALPPNTYSNASVYPQGEAVNVLLLDGLNTPLGDQMQVRQQMIAFAAKMPAGTPMAIFTLASRLRLLQGFTREPAALVAALQNPKLDAKQSVLLDTQATQESMSDDMAAMGASAAAVSSAQAVRGRYQDLPDRCTRAHDTGRDGAAGTIPERNSGAQKFDLVFRIVPDCAGPG